MARNILTSLDIGTSRIRAVIAIRDERHQLRIIGVGVASTTGMRHGAVVDVEDVTRAIARAVEEAERMAGEPFHTAVVGVGGSQIKSGLSKGVIAVARAGNEIMAEDVNRAIEVAAQVTIPANQQVLRAVPRSFSVDNETDVKDPIGMTGIRLEVEAQIFTASVPFVKNIEKCVKNVGIQVIDIVPNILAASEIMLTRRQKELGVCIVDIGMGGSSVAIYNDGSLLHTDYFPAGGESITNDLAIGLRTSIETAETVKIEYGAAMISEINKRDAIDLSQLSKIDQQQISKVDVTQIIEARMSEIFYLVRGVFRSIGYDGLLPAGVVLIGGGIKIPYTIDLARTCLNLPVQIGFPQVDSVVDIVDDPSYVNVIGLLLFTEQKSASRSKKSKSNGKSFIDSLKEWIKHLLP